MLERVLEPEVMDSQEDADEYAAFDNRAVNEEFVARALELAPSAGVVLDIGTGPADIAILLAQRSPRLHLVAIDLGEHMLKMARENVIRAGLSARVQIERADAKSTGQARGGVDMVISNSLVHHIPDPALFFAEVQRVVAPGGGIFVKDLHRPESQEEHAHLVRTYAAGCTDYQTRIFSDSLRAALTVREVRALCAEVGLEGVEVRKTSDRHWCLERRAPRRA
jgi:ubiquinone/menaquinone biosynthesis C-methylase UbiE